MTKVKIVLGFKSSEGNVKIEVIEAVADDPSNTRAMLIEPHAKEGKYDYLTVIDAWQVEEGGEAELKLTDD
jgi:hypothetical protein